MLVSKAPLRVSLFGGGTDFPDFYRRFGGGVIGGTIDKFIYTTLLPLSALAEQNFRVQYRTVESVMSIEDISHPFIREILRKLKIEQKLNIATVSDLPGGTGLGSSSSFAIGLIKALSHMFKVNFSDEAILDLSLEIERHALNEYGGVQDQFHATFGGFKYYKFSKEMTEQEELLDENNLKFLSKSSILVSTGSTRSASSISKNLEIKVRNQSNDYILQEMNKITDAALKEFRNFNSFQSLETVGSLLNESWKLKRSLDMGVSNSVVDNIYSQGLRLGAYGGKLLGAGAHGFVYFLLPQELRINFLQHFGTSNCVSFKFITDGVKCFEV